MSIQSALDETPQTDWSRSAVHLDRLTGEVFLYLLIIGVALALRLSDLVHYPLNTGESVQALAALDVYQGRIPAGGVYSPLLVSLTGLVFLLFGDADWAARLVPALLGSALAVFPFFLRRQLGSVAALIASGLLVFSATTLFWSRTLSGDMVAAVGVALLWIGLIRWLEEGQSSGLYGVVTGLVFLLLGGPGGFTALAASLLLLPGLFFTGHLAGLKQKFAEDGVALQRAGWWGGALFLVLATAATFNVGGLAAISDVVTQWLGQFGLQPQAEAGPAALLTLFLYEPLILFFGLAGVVPALQSGRLGDRLPVIWLALIIGLDLVMGGRGSGQVVLAAFPLALLAGRQIGAWAENWRRYAHLESDGLLVAISLMILGFSAISLVSWVRCTVAQAGCTTAWVLPLAGMLLITSLAIIFGGWYGSGVAWRGLGAVLLVATACLSGGMAWRLSYGPLGNLPFQTPVALPPSIRLPIMLDDISRASMERTGDAHTISIAVVNLDAPVLRWYLRQYDQVRYVRDFASVEDAEVILARPDTGHPVSGAYAGEEFSLVSYWRLGLLEGKQAVNWYLYRLIPTHIPGSDQVVMWLKTNSEQ